MTAVANGGTHTGRSIPITDTSGAFWLFSPGNAEVGVKILVTGTVKTYTPGPFCGGADVDAF